AAPRRARPAGRRPALAGDVARVRSAAPRAPAHLGSDPLVGREDVREADLALPRDRSRVRADLAARLALAGPPSPCDQRPRRPDRRWREQRRSRLLRPRDRNGIDAARARARAGGDGARTRRARRRRVDRSSFGVPTDRPQPRALVPQPPAPLPPPL